MCESVKDRLLGYAKTKQKPICVNSVETTQMQWLTEKLDERWPQLTHWVSWYVMN